MDEDHGPIGALRRWLWNAPPAPEAPEPSERAEAAPPDSPAEDQDLLTDDPLLESQTAEITTTPPSESPPRFTARAFWMPKLGDDESEWEDAFAYDERLGLAGVADGASEGIFSRAWSALVCTSLVADPIDLGDPEAVTARLDTLRAAWLREIDYPSRRYTQQAKVDQIGAAATLLVLQLRDELAGTETPDGELCWRAWAVGDSCLFHIRDGHILASFPVASSADFGLAPALLRTRPGIAPPVAEEPRGTCRVGDLFVLATDAVAQALLNQVETGTPPDWDRFESLDLGTWRGEIDDLRHRRAIVNDDSTLLALRVIAREPIAQVDEPGREDDSGVGQSCRDEGSESTRQDGL